MIEISHRTVREKQNPKISVARQSYNIWQLVYGIVMCAHLLKIQIIILYSITIRFYLK